MKPPPSPSSGELQRLYEESLREQRQLYGAPDATLHAIIHQLRRDGLKSLRDPDCQHRLALCTSRQVGEVIARLDRIRGELAGDHR